MTSRTPMVERVAVEWPLDAETLEDLRWYLEDYLRWPFAVYSERGSEVATRFRIWGEEAAAWCRRSLAKRKNSTLEESVTDPAAEGARAAARRLGLVAEVEATLHTQDVGAGVGGKPEQYFDPVALASLIVSAAALAWTVYSDLKKKADKPSPDVVTRTVTTQLRRSQALTGEQEETVAITVQETIRAIDG